MVISVKKVLEEKRRQQEQKNGQQATKRNCKGFNPAKVKPSNKKCCQPMGASGAYV